jgi:hypothetical protein
MMACYCTGPIWGMMCRCQAAWALLPPGQLYRTEYFTRPQVAAHGCICPPGAEETCQGQQCPRRPATPTEEQGEG